ncbi:MAG: DUF4175 domain-containing protein [Candidatus Cloacimonetes bacterium]|nr:DUF4175 domain-containing protein [Candidatus Cloacimonadota bacterium]
MKKILYKINNFKIKQNFVEISTYFVYIFVVLLLLMQIYSVFDLLYPNNIVENYWISQILKFSWIAFAIWLGLLYEKRLINSLQAAKSIDKICDLKDDVVTNSYEMITNTPEGNKLVIATYLQEKEDFIDNLTPQLDKALFKKSLTFLVLMISTIILQYFIAGSSVRESYHSFYRQKRPLEVFRQAIEVSPGDINISSGSSVTIRILNHFEQADYLIFYRFEDTWRSEPLNDGNRQFNNIDRSFEYFIQNQWAGSDTFFVRVLDDPNVKRISLKYTYPDYLNRRTEYIENSDGLITIPQFTEVEMVIETPETVAEANIVFSDRSFLTMENYGRDTWLVNFTPEESMNYHFSLIDELGTRNQIVNRSITIIRDLPPLIEIVYPARDTIMTQNNLFEIRLVASDDYGLRNLRIFHQINQNPVQDTLVIRQSNQNFITLSHIFDFRQSPLFPGDEVIYWAEVFDNSPLNQKAETRRFKLRFPSIEDIFREIEREEEERSNMLTQALQDIQEMQRDFDLQRREMLRRDDMNWEDQRALERFINDQQTLNEMVENVAENYDRMIDNLQQNEAVSQDILDKMQRIQEIMETITTDDLRRAMEELSQSMENMNPDEIRTAMENFQFNMQDFAEKLEQTLRLLEDIKNEQNLERSLEIAREMADMQENLLSRTEESSDTSSLAEEQKRIEEKLAALQEQMQKTIDDMQNSRNNDFMQNMQDLMQDMQESQLSESLSEATDSLQQNQKENAMSAQQQSLSQMRRMTARMEQMQSDMSGAGAQAMLEALEMTIFRMLMISKEHIDKVNRIGNDPIPFMTGFVNDFESVQLAINQLYLAPQILLFLGQKFFTDLNDMINAYRTFFQEVQNSRLTTHRRHTSAIQAGINLTIHNLMQALDNMQQSGGSGGGGGMESLMQSLQQMSSQQMMMNTLTHSIFEQMTSSGNRASNQMRQQLQDVAAEEERLANNLRRMMHTNPEAQRHSNALNEIVRELEEVSQRIRQNRIDSQLVEQQNRIMSRLLEVQRSINSRDRSNQRRGETADDNIWDLPSDIDLNLGNLTERRLLEDELQRLPVEYRQMILEYLRRINQ